MLRHLGVDPLALPAARIALVKSHVGGKVWRLALAAPTYPARARIMLEAIARRAAEDEADTDTSGQAIAREEAA